jgi:hypothetical protein
MIKHIVMWKIKEASEFGPKEKVMPEVKKRLLALKSHIAEIRHMEVGLNIPDVHGNYDVVLVTTFESLDDLNKYQQNATHQEVAAFIGKVRDERACVDFVIEG